MELCLVEALSGFLDNLQGLGKQDEPPLCRSRFPQCLGQQTNEVRLKELRAGSQVSLHATTHLLYSFNCFSLLNQYPAQHDSLKGRPERKSVFGRYAQARVREALCHFQVFPKLMESGRDTLSISKAIRMRKQLGQTECIEAALESLIRVARTLQGPGQKDGGSHPGVLPRIGKSQRTMFFKVIHGNAAFQVFA